MQTSRRGIITIAIIMLALVAGVVLTVLHFNRSGEGDTAQQTTGNNAADAPRSNPSQGNTAENRPQPAPAPAPSNTASSQTPTELANTGPGDMVTIFVAAAALGAVGHFILRRRFSIR